MLSINLACKSLLHPRRINKCDPVEVNGETGERRKEEVGQGESGKSWGL